MSNFNPNKELRGDLWETLNADQLYAQKILLQEKMDYAAMSRSQAVYDQLASGMKRLQLIIEEKSQDRGPVVIF